jgi:hypothetical protein
MPIDIADNLDRGAAFLTILAGSIWGLRNDPVTWFLLVACIACGLCDGQRTRPSSPRHLPRPSRFVCSPPGGWNSASPIEGCHEAFGFLLCCWFSPMRPMVLVVLSPLHFVDRSARGAREICSRAEGHGRDEDSASDQFCRSHVTSNLRHLGGRRFPVRSERRHVLSVKQKRRKRGRARLPFESFGPSNDHTVRAIANRINLIADPRFSLHTTRVHEADGDRVHRAATIQRSARQ